MAPLSHACKCDNHSWCLESAYDKATSSTTKCSCDCHVNEQVDDGEI